MKAHSRDGAMQTILDIDDDLAVILRQRARDLGLPFEEVVNLALRAGLGDQLRPHQGGAPRTIPHSFGLRPGIDPDKLGQLADKLEAEAAANKHRERARRQPPLR